ncbi:UNVERIFIED_CONTAM: hypothetical protein GTU68_031738, partial [Idotea baltica]|nr:hypothetical protein [Idotea baltica]
AIIFGGGAPSPSQFDCTTPDSKQGSCIKLFDCKPLYTRLRSGSTPPDFISFLRKSVCRYDNNLPIVCCAGVTKEEKKPATSFVIPIGATTPASTQPPPSTPAITTKTPVEPETQAPTQSPTDPAPDPGTEAPPSEPPTEATPEPSTEPPPTQPPSTESPIGKLTGFDLLPGKCGNSTRTTTRIVGGRISDEGAWPWLGALGYKTFKGELDFLCGGALITTQHILTAAHCVHRRNDLGDQMRSTAFPGTLQDDTAHAGVLHCQTSAS